MRKFSRWKKAAADLRKKLVSAQQQEQKKANVTQQQHKLTKDKASLQFLRDIDSSSLNDFVCGAQLNAKTILTARVLEVLTVTRVQELSLDSKIRLIRQLQRRITSPLFYPTSKKKLHTAVTKLLLSTPGTQLTLLKEEIGSVNSVSQLVKDGSASNSSNFFAGDLHQLIFGNKNVTEMCEVIQHLTLQSLQLEDNAIKVISDIDDTLYPGWVDRRFPAHVPYPGVSRLFQILSSNITHNDSKFTIESGSITFLTARPRGWFNIGRNLTTQHLTTLGLANPTVLSGSMTGLITNSRIAQLKFENFKRYCLLYPEYKFVFFGDSGQGDALLGSHLLKDFSHKISGVFIHDVNPDSRITGDGGLKSSYEKYDLLFVDDFLKAYVTSDGMCFYNTYAGAALQAFRMNLISRTDLCDIATTCEVELEKIPFKNDKEKYLERRKELQDDLKIIFDLRK